MADEIATEMDTQEKITQVMCGHCKYTCQDIEALKDHMRAHHLQNLTGNITLTSDSGQSAAPRPVVPATEIRKQTVVVYKQSADGTAINTGQVVQLTQTQIAQLLNSTPVASQKPLHLATNSQQPLQIQQTELAPYMPLQGSSVSSGGKKQLLVVGSENVETLQKTAMATLGASAMNKPKLPPASAAAARSSLLLAGVPTFVSKDYPADKEEGTVELKFQFVITGNDDIIDEHIKPMVSFQCQHCGYKDGSYAKATVHAKNFHLAADGTVIRTSKSWTSTSMFKTDENLLPQLTEEDLSCPYCLTKFFTLDDRDNHRLKKCGPKQRYEVKRTAVRSLQKHLLCSDTNCTRALYFSTHLMAIKHPRATFGACHRNNGSSHYFSCYICSAKSGEKWKETPAKVFEAKVNGKIKEFNEKLMEEIVIDTDKPLEDKDDKSPIVDLKAVPETSTLPPTRIKTLVVPEAMQVWDFSTWSDCAQHLVLEHEHQVAHSPKCETCSRQLTSCNELCHHVFNNEIEYIENGLCNLRRRVSKKAAKKGLIFGLGKDNPADRMLFLDVTEDTPGLAMQGDEKPGEVVRKTRIRNKHFMCRTCGQGFSTSSKRDKHNLSNACVRDKIIKKFECTVCHKRFTMKKTVLAHETWCMYKQKRDALYPKPTAAAVDDVTTRDGVEDADADPAADNDGANEDEDMPVVGPGGDSVLTGEKKEKRKRAVKYKCAVHGCIMGFNTEEELNIHGRCHVGNSVVYQCCFCDFSAAATINWYPLKEHIIAKHPGNIPPDYKCLICDKGFAKQSKYDDHMTKHSTERLHTCIECGLTFKQESGLRTHVQYEHGSVEAREAAKLALKQRASENQAHQPLLCYVCGYSTTSRSYYKTHMNIHKGVKPYSCKYCDYKSVDSTCFKRHMWRHEDKKPYKCPYCTFDGIQRSQIVAHMKTKHGVWAEDAKKLIKHISGRAASNLQRLLSKNGNLSPGIDGTEDDILPAEAAETTSIDANTTTVSIVNPDGSETTIPVELITQAAQGLAAGTNVQVSYGDYLINYTLEKPAEEGEDGVDVPIETAASALMEVEETPQ